MYTRNYIFILFILFCLLSECCTVKTCIRKNYPGLEPAMVCVCNSTYCDEIPPLGELPPNQAAIYTSSISGKRFERTTSTFQINADATEPGRIQIQVTSWSRFQPIIGFGGAFTDAVGINLNSLSENARQNLLKAYFGDDGIGYTLGRVPMGSCDFSTRVYSYADVSNDFDLKYFNLTQEDFELKIPYLKIANELSNNTLKLFATPWAAPGWLKTTNKMAGGGQLKGDTDGPYYEVFSRYIVKFFEEYAKAGIEFWGMTPLNEPSGNLDSGGFQSMHMDAKMEGDFIKGLLGPLMKTNNLTKDIKIMIFDDDRESLPDYAVSILSDYQTSQYVAGTAIHWYDDVPWDSVSKLQDVYFTDSSKFILYTEASNGAFIDSISGPNLGDWERGVGYANDIIQTINNFASGWTDWNICLDEQGGPNWIGNFLDSPIIVNSTADEFYKQPMFYFLGHFSKFIPPNVNATRFALEFNGNDYTTSPIGGIAVLLPENERRILVLHNPMYRDYNVTIRDQNYYNVYNKSLEVTIEQRSIMTFVWDKPVNDTN